MGVILSVLSLVFNGVGGVVKSIFQTKSDKINMWREGIVGLFLALRQAGVTEVAEAQIMAQVILADAQSEHWLAACWRPLIGIGMFITCLLMILAGYHGVMPPEMNGTMSKFFDATIQLVGGYGILRSGDKLVNKIGNSKLIENLTTNAIRKIGIPMPPVKSNDEDE